MAKKIDLLQKFTKKNIFLMRKSRILREKSKKEPFRSFRDSDLFSGSSE